MNRAGGSSYKNTKERLWLAKLDKRAVNSKSDELQMTIMNCIKCGRVYQGNVISALCPDCHELKDIK